MRVLSRFRPPNEGWVYVHQGSITEDMKYVLMDDEGDEPALQVGTTTHVIDVRNLRKPRFVGKHISNKRAIDHNQYVVGQYSFQANYDAGLQILRIDDPENLGLVEEAYFDVEPGHDYPEFKGAWSVYPYFASGTVLVSTIEGGLFVLRPRLQVPPCPRSSEECGSNSLYTNDFLIDGQSYSGIKIIPSPPPLPRGGSGGFVGKISIPNERKRRIASEDVDVDVVAGSTIRLVAKVGLKFDATSKYKFLMKIFFDNNQVETAPRMMLGASAHESYQYYRRDVNVPSGAQRIVKVQYRIVKSDKMGDRNAVLIDTLSISRGVKGSVSTAAATRSADLVNNGSGDNVFRHAAPREGNL